MNDPYEVLGVSRNAGLDEIKTAYKTLVKKYHPDRYVGNPLADLAQEKMQEINEAYDYIEKNHGSGNMGYSSNTGYNTGNSQSSYGSGNRTTDPEKRTRYDSIRNCINRHDYAAAETILAGVNDRDAEWFFLNGMINYGKGYYDEANSNISQAVKMDPNNFEYARIYQTMHGRNGMSGQGGNLNEDMCRALQCYFCADLMCPCF